MKGEYNKIEVVEGQHCPLCGSKAELWEYVTDYNTTKSVMCSGGEECILSLTPDSFHKPTKREAVDHWINFVQSTQAFKLESKLAASEVALKESHEAFEIVKKQHLIAMQKMIEWKQRAEAAEKLIEDSRKQEPIEKVVVLDEVGRQIVVTLQKPLYPQPPIPPELSEVMRERDELKRLLSEARKVQEWQPIETAPKDGTTIIGWNAEFGARQTKMNFYGLGSIGYAEWERGEGPKESGWDWTEPKNNWGFSWNPTHWMPLPASPTYKEQP